MLPKVRGPYSGNHLLHSLGSADLSLISPFLEWIDHNAGDVLQSSRVSAPFIYFPVSAVYSASSIGGNDLEAGLIGREGLAGLSVYHRVGKPAFKIVVQTAGRSLRIADDDFLRATKSSERLNRMLLRYSYAFLVQVAQTALANARMTLQQRLARWLLMCQDRVDGPDLAITHGRLSELLGVRRAGITVALQTLEATGIIKSTRGRVRINDRAKLKHIAGTSYGRAEVEYQRMMRAK